MNDDITWFDQRPTHPTRPAEYQAAIDAARAAWQEYQDFVDRAFEGGPPTEEELAELQSLLAIATTTEYAKEAAYREWMTAGFNPTRSEPSEHIRHMVGE